MAIIYSYPIVVATLTDLVLGSDISGAGNPTKNFTVQSLIDLVPNNLGDLQAVLDIGNTATGGNASITLGTLAAPQGFVSTASFTDGTLVISGGNLTTAGAVTALNLSGTLLTNSQPNVTSLGTLTSLAVNTSVTGTAVVTTLSAPGDNLKIASTKAIVDYIATKPSKETLAETLVAGSVTGGTDIQVSAGDDVTFTDTSKALFGAAPDLEIFHNGTHNFIQSKTATAGLFIQNEDSNIILRKSTSVDPAESGSMAKFLTDAAVELYFNASKKFETSNTGVQVIGVASTSAGSVGAPAYTFTGDLNTGMFHPAADELGFSTNGVLRLKVKNAGVDITGVTTTTSFTTTASTGGVITRITTEGEGIAANDVDTMIPTNAAVKDYVDTQSDAKTLNYKDATATTYQMNLFGDTLQLAGGTNITSAALAVAANKAVVTFNLDNSIVLSGQVKADNFTTTAGTATWATTVLAGFTSITSDLFTGPLTGNATTATALAATGAITLLGDTTSTGGPYTYTAGGALNISTTIADTTVTGKVLTGYSVVTSGAIDANDSILEAFEKIQATITGLPEGGINYIGTWNASGGGGGVPDLTVAATHVPGHYYVVGADSPAAGTFPNGGAVPPSEWKIGDWVIRADSTLNLWQKLDNTSSIEGSGAVNKVARWTSSQILGTGLITDDLSTVTIGNTGAFVVEGNATFGNTDTDTVTVKGPARFEEITRLDLGLSANGSEGSATQVLTSGGAGAAMSWQPPTVGTLTIVGLTETGNALTITNSPLTGAGGNINIAGAGAPGQYINGELNLVGFPVLDNYVSWTIEADDANTEAITSGAVVDFVGVGNVSTAWDATSNELRISASENPGTGTQYTLPVWDTTSTLDDSMVSQNAGGTELTVAGTINSGSITSTGQIFCSTNTTTPTNGQAVFYKSSAGTVVSGYQVVLESGSAASRATALTISDSQNATFTGSVDVTGNIISRTNASYYATRNYLGETWEFASDTADGVTFKITGGAANTTGNFFKFQTQAGTATPATALTINKDLSSTFSGNVNISKDGAVLRITDTAITNTSFNTLVLRASDQNKFSLGVSSTVGTADTITIDGATTNVGFAGNVEIDGNLTVDGNIIHGGHGGGTGKGGVFNVSKSITSSTQGLGQQLFSVLRPGTGAIAFRVTITSGESAAVSRTKVFEFAKSFGTFNQAFNQVIDSGPNSTTPGNDFSVDFNTVTNPGFPSSTTASGSSTIPVSLVTASPGMKIKTERPSNPGLGSAFPAGTRIVSLASQGVAGATMTLDADSTYTLFSNDRIIPVPDDIVVCTIIGVDTTSQKISATIELGYDENTVATVLIPSQT